MPISTKSLHILALFLASTIAAPAPQAGSGVFAPPYCQTKYTVDTQDTVAGDLIVGDYTVAGGSDLTVGSAFETSVTVTAGVDVSVSDIAGVGLTASVSITTTKQTSQGASGPCPDGPWKCALAIYPEMLKVTGKLEADNNYCGDREKAGELPDPYTVYYPVENETVGIRSRIEVCACKNYEHWADKGAPSIVCEKCAL